MNDILILVFKFADPPEQLVHYVVLMNKSYCKEKYGFDKESVDKKPRMKCEQYKFWLFCDDSCLDESYLRKVIKNNP